MIKKKAFTLAEVLITLAIIGVVAAMTVPSLLQGQQEKATVTALKKAFSTLSNAFTLAVNDNGTPDNWGMIANPSSPMLDKLKPYLNVAKDCTDGSKGCFPTGVNYKYLAPTQGNIGVIDDWNEPALKLADGTLLLGEVNSSDCSSPIGNSTALKNVCGNYYVDINGYKSPNQVGKDVYRFWLTKFGIIPMGNEQQTASYTFSIGCKDKDVTTGFGCAAWVIYNENLDYLHCSGLDWNGPTKCP